MLQALACFMQNAGTMYSRLVTYFAKESTEPGGESMTILIDLNDLNVLRGFSSSSNPPYPIWMYLRPLQALMRQSYL